MSFFFRSADQFCPANFRCMASIFQNTLDKKKVASQILDVADANFLKFLQTNINNNK